MKKTVDGCRCDVCRRVDLGTYGAATAPDAIKGFFAEGSGSIKAHQGEGPNGVMLFLK